MKHALIPQSLISTSYVAPKTEDDDHPPTAALSPPLAPTLAAKLDILSSDPYFSPLVAEDLSDLPHAYIIACEYDVLRDDAILYARRLAVAGVRTETRVEKGAWHAIMFKTNLVTISKGVKITADMTKYIREKV